MVTYHDGDLLKSGCQMICHQVNEFGVMGAGIAKQIKAQFPKAYQDYKEFCNIVGLKHGKVVFSENDGVIIANCFSQIYWQTEVKLVEEVVKTIIKYCKDNQIKTVGIPYKYGCGLAGGDWVIVQRVFLKHFENSDINLQIWKYEN